MVVSTAKMNARQFLQLGEDPPGVKLELVTVEGWELRRGKYVAIGRAQGVDTIRLEPFPDLEIPLKKLWQKRR